MNDRVFGDPKRRPTAKAIASALGKASAAWVSLFTRIHEEHPTLTEEWRYYDDGKSWLLKVSRKSKTVFWGSVTPVADIDRQPGCVFSELASDPRDHEREVSHE